MGLQRARPSHEILSGDSADVYFARAETILEREGLDPVVTMEVFDAPACGAVRHRRGPEPARPRPGHGRPGGDPSRGARRRRHHRAQGGRPPDPGPLPHVRAVRDGGARDARPVDRLGDGRARVRRRGGARSRSISFGARHVHPDITDVLDYAAIVGGCVGASTPAGARLAGLAPTGTMPHSLVLIFGDTVEAALAFDRHIGPGGAADRARRHVQGRGRGGAARRPRAGRPAVRRPPRHAVGARSRHRRTSSTRSGRGSTRPASST